jgi:ligand-binding SRPBCC domain-containing protein
MLHYERSTLIQAPVEEVWAFHERGDVLELISPPWALPRVLVRKGALRTGSRIEMKIPFGPFRIRWLSLHVDHEDLHHFTDEQIRGPFRYWRHLHLFEPEGGGTRLTDRVEFKLPLDFLSGWMIGWLVKLRLRRLFEYRHSAIRRHCER